MTVSRPRLGCAMWALPAWRERYGVPVGRELAWYGHVFDTVEGNTTFYAVPRADVVERWAELAPASLRFCFKLPRSLTHDRRLRLDEDGRGELARFLTVLGPLRDRLGPLQVQLPASFGPDEAGVLIDFLDWVRTTVWLDPEPAWAVELRHPDFAAGGAMERVINDALAARGINRVILDSRALFDVAPQTPAEVEAQRAKPRLPVRPVATGTEPLIRLIGQSDHAASLACWTPWVPTVAQWVAEGLTPHVFVHTPDNVTAPELAYRLWDALAPHLPDTGAVRPPLEPSRQLDLW